MQSNHLLQLRRVPDPVHRELKARAAREGLSLQAYVLRELERLVSRPTMAEVLGRISARGPLVAAGQVAAWRGQIAPMVEHEREARVDTLLEKERDR